MLKFNEEAPTTISLNDLRGLKSMVTSIYKEQKLKRPLTANDKDRASISRSNSASTSKFTVKKLGAIVGRLNSLNSSFAEQKLMKKTQSQKNSFLIRKENNEAPSIQPQDAEKIRLFQKKRRSVMYIPKQMKISQVTPNETTEDFKNLSKDIMVIFDKIIQRRLFSLEVKRRIFYILEKKKDEKARVQMNALEYKYGKKVLNIFNSGNRFKFFNQVDTWKNLANMFDNVIRILSQNYELSKFERSMSYSLRLIRKKSRNLQNPIFIPRMYSRFFKSKSDGYILPYANLQLFIKYIYLIERFQNKRLDSINALRIEATRFFQKKSPSMHEIQKIMRDLNPLIAMLNLDTSKGHIDKMIRKMNKNEFLMFARIIRRIREDFQKRLDTQLLNLKIASHFSKCYSILKNREKSYKILMTAWEQSKSAIDDYLQSYIKYYCLKGGLKTFLNSSDFIPNMKTQLHEYQGVLKNLSLLENLSQRMPYLDEYFNERFISYLSIDDIKEILIELGEFALKFKDYANCIEYFETYLFVIDNVDRLLMYSELDSESSEIKSKITKRDKIIKLIHLNIKYMKYTNKLLEACVYNYEYMKSLIYTINLLFIYNNTIKMIHEDDPYYYPTKKPNDIILMQKEKFDREVESKLYFQKHVQFFNHEYKKTVALAKTLWGNANAKSSNKLDKKLYNAIKDCLDDVEQVNVYSEFMYKRMLRCFTEVPTIVGEKDSKGRILRPKFIMAQYFPKYIGKMEKNPFEEKVLARVVYLGRLTEEELSSANDKIKGFQIATATSKSKNLSKLTYDDIGRYFSLENDEPTLQNGLLRWVTWKDFQNKKKSYKESMQEITKDFPPVVMDKLRERMGALEQIYLDQKESERNRIAKENERKYSNYALWIKDRHIKAPQLNDIQAVIKMQNVDQRFKPSSFFKSNYRQVQEVRSNFGLEDYGENQVDILEPLKRSISAQKPRKDWSVPCRDRIHCSWNISAYFEFRHIGKKMSEIRKDRVIDVMTRALRSIFPIQDIEMVSKIKRRAKNKGADEYGDYGHIYESTDQINENPLLFDVGISTGKQDSNRYELSLNLDLQKIEFECKEISFRYLSPLRFNLTMDFDGRLDYICDYYKSQGTTIFQTYWPVLFMIFKKKFFTPLLYARELSQARMKSLNEAQNRELYQICKEIGIAFELKFSSLDEVMKEAVEMLNLIHYRKKDLLALQAFSRCFKIILSCLNTCVIHVPVGKRFSRSIDLLSFTEKYSHDSFGRLSEFFMISHEINTLRNKALSLSKANKLGIECSSNKDLLSFRTLRVILDQLHRQIQLADIIRDITPDPCSPITNYLSTSLIKLEHLGFYYMNLSLSINRENVYSSISHVNKVEKEFISNSTKGEIIISENSLCILLLLYIAESIFSFHIDIKNTITLNLDEPEKNDIMEGVDEDADPIERLKIFILLKLPKTSLRVQKGASLSVLQMLMMHNASRNRIFRTKVWASRGSKYWINLQRFNDLLQSFDLITEVKSPHPQLLPLLLELFSFPFTFPTMRASWPSVVHNPELDLSHFTSPTSHYILLSQALGQDLGGSLFQGGLLSSSRSRRRLCSLSFDYSKLSRHLPVSSFFQNSALEEALNSVFLPGSRNHRRGEVRVSYAGLALALGQARGNQHVSLKLEPHKTERLIDWRQRQGKVEEVEKMLFKVAAKKGEEKEEIKGGRWGKGTEQKKKYKMEGLFADHFNRIIKLRTRKDKIQTSQDFSEISKLINIENGTVVFISDKPLFNKYKHLLTAKRSKINETSTVPTITTGKDSLHKNYLRLKQFEIEYFKTCSYNFNQNGLNGELRVPWIPMKSVLGDLTGSIEIYAVPESSSEESDISSRLPETRCIYIKKEYNSKNIKARCSDPFSVKLKIYYDTVVELGFLLIRVTFVELKIFLHITRISTIITINDGDYLLKILRIMMLGSTYIQYMELRDMLVNKLSRPSPLFGFEESKRLLMLPKSVLVSESFICIIVHEGADKYIDSKVNELQESKIVHNLSDSNILNSKGGGFFIDFLRKENFTQNDHIKVEKILFYKSKPNRRTQNVVRKMDSFMEPVDYEQGFGFKIKRKDTGFINRAFVQNMNNEHMRISDINSLNVDIIKKRMIKDTQDNSGDPLSICGLDAKRLSFTVQVTHVGQCYVKATVFFPRTPVSLVDKTIRTNEFKDTHILYDFFFEVFAQRIITLLNNSGKGIEKLVTFKSAKEARKLIQRRGAKGYDPQKSKKALMNWLACMKGMKMAFEFKSITKRAINKVLKRLAARIKEIVEEERALSSVLNIDEIFMIKFEFYKRRSKNYCSKLLLNWRDIEQFFQLQEFIELYFPHRMTPQDFGNVPPRTLFCSFLRYIIRLVRFENTITYSKPVIFLQKNLRYVGLSNNFSRFETHKNIRQFGLTDSLSNTFQIVYKRVCLVNSTYAIYTVRKNSFLKIWDISVYFPKLCRNYIFLLKVEDIKVQMFGFMKEILALLHRCNLSPKIKTYEEFCEYWDEAQPLKSRLISATSQEEADDSLEKSLLNVSIDYHNKTLEVEDERTPGNTGNKFLEMLDFSPSIINRGFQRNDSLFSNSGRFPGDSHKPLRLSNFGNSSTFAGVKPIQMKEPRRNEKFKSHIPTEQKLHLMKFDDFLHFEESNIATIQDLINHIDVMGQTIGSRFPTRIFKLICLKSFQTKLDFKNAVHLDLQNNDGFISYVTKLGSLMKNIFNFIEKKVAYMIVISFGTIF